VDIGIYTPQKKSAQVNFLWGKNDVKTAIQQFYTLPPQKKLLYPQNKFLATLLALSTASRTENGTLKCRQATSLKR